MAVIASLGGVLAVAGSMSLSICRSVPQQPLNRLRSWDTLDDA